MNEGALICLQRPSALMSVAHALDGCTHCEDDCLAVARRPGESDTHCLQRTIQAIRTFAPTAAVGLALGPLPPDDAAHVTHDRARRAAHIAAPGDIILAWGSQAHLPGHFESAGLGFVRLIALHD